MKTTKSIKDILVQEMPFFFICPALLWQVLFLYVPLFILLLYSFSTKDFTVTLQHYKQVLQPFSLRILGNSFMLAFETTVLCFLLAYPLAYFLTFKLKKNRTLGLLLVILPSWTSFIVQIYAWFFLLKKDGAVSHVLCWLGIFNEPTHILNNHAAMLIGMVYCFLPFMVLPIYAVLEKIDRRLIEASADLGATRWKTIQKIIFPLSLRGLGAGLFLVFIPAFGEFVIPEFLGGSKKMYWGNVIVSKFLDYRDWHAGAAAAYSGILFPALAIAILYVLVRMMRRVIGGRPNPSIRFPSGNHSGRTGSGQMGFGVERGSGTNRGRE
ncbi:ABC transporter permease [Candidatus Dependentiae bacterium]|nr:ABC transporter permease [Candidatus Dependentiae bacterium]